MGAERENPWIVEIGLTVGFLVLAAWFIWGSPDASIPPTRTVTVAERELSREPLRAGRFKDALITIGSFTRRCGECHDLFPSPPAARRDRTQHTDIVLDHGLNDRCFNCHDRDDRDRLALRGGETVAFDEVPRLCAKCHGPTYRDWQSGMHGRTAGSWDPASGAQTRLICSDCHDPHAPAYAPMRPLPSPRTLRMGPQEMHLHGEHVERLDPLRKWLTAGKVHHDEPAADEPPDEPLVETGYDDGPAGAG